MQNNSWNEEFKINKGGIKNEYTKDETVYSKLDASGSNYKTIVSTHIENTENEELIKDLSDLLNVKNTSGDETFTQDGSTFTWNANKNDIYYQ